MKRLSDFLQVMLGVAFLVVLALVLVVVFRAVSGGGGAGAPVATQTVQGYPPPQETVEIPATPSLLPPGYPPPATAAVEATALDSTQIAQSTALAATVAAERIATSRAPAPTPQGPLLVGPQVITDATGQFSLKLSSGWSALSWGATMSIVNYDYAEAEKLGTVPPGGLGIQIGVDKLPEGQTFEQWQAKWIALETSPDVAGAGAVASYPSPYQLGQYTGSTFTITGPFPSVMEIDLLSEGQIVIIGLAPADSPALQEALAMLSTLEIFSKPKP